jgi:hypothetical protein
MTMVYGPIAAFLVEMFPTKIRYTSMSLPYHIGNGWFGGMLPLLATAIVATTGDIYAGLCIRSAWRSLTPSSARCSCAIRGVDMVTGSGVAIQKTDSSEAAPDRRRSFPSSLSPAQAGFFSHPRRIDFTLCDRCGDRTTSSMVSCAFFCRASDFSPCNCAENWYPVAFPRVLVTGCYGQG